MRIAGIFVGFWRWKRHIGPSQGSFRRRFPRPVSSWRNPFSRRAKAKPNWQSDWQLLMELLRELQLLHRSLLATSKHTKHFNFFYPSLQLLPFGYFIAFHFATPTSPAVIAVAGVLGVSSSSAVSDYIHSINILCACIIAIKFLMFSFRAHCIFMFRPRPAPFSFWPTPLPTAVGIGRSQAISTRSTADKHLSHTHTHTYTQPGVPLISLETPPSSTLSENCKKIAGKGNKLGKRKLWEDMKKQ